MEKYLQQSTALFGSIKNAVLGNPVTREFNIGQQVASFGPGLLWKVFDGKKKTTGQDVAVFMFEKALIDRFDRRDREHILEKMRHGPQQLTKLRHPRILTVQHPLEESRDSLAFATEPIFGSLSNIMGKHENFANGIPPNFKDFELYSVEKVYGLLQIAEALSFLHNDASLIEGNLSADNIIVTKGGQWKLAGFHFSRSKLDNTSIKEYTTTMAPVGRQELNYLAPEWVFSQAAGEFTFDLTKSDMFSFGCLISSVYNHLKTPFDAGDSLPAYKKSTEQLSRLGSDYLKNVPIQVRDHVNMLLNVAAESRPDARATMSHPFFDDVAAMTLKYLDSLVQRDDVTKSQFFKNLHHVLDKLPVRVLHQRVLPPLFSEFPNHMMIPFVLSNVFIIAKQSTREQYMELIFPELKKIFQITKPIQVLLIFMQQMELMLKMTSEAEIKNYVLPLIFRALEAPSEQIQELVLTIIPNFVHMVDFSSLKNAIVPRLKTLVTKSKALMIQVNALVCFGKIIDHLDKFILIDEIFPALTQIPSRDPAVLMGVLGIYKQTLNHKNIHLEKDYLATKAIPFLLPLSVEPSLNVQQFNNFMSVLREMFDRVEQEHRTKLEQLQKMQDEQRSSIDFVKASNQNASTSSSTTDNIMSKVDSLVTGTHSNSANVKKISSDSEFAQMFGLSDDSPTKSNDLLGSTSTKQTTSKPFIDTSSFDSNASKPTHYHSNKVQTDIVTSKTLSLSSSATASRLIASNLDQMSHSNMKSSQFESAVTQKPLQQKPDLSSLNSILTPEMNQFTSRQQSLPMASLQHHSMKNNAGYLSRPPNPAYQQHPSFGYTSGPQLNAPFMQGQTQSITVHQTRPQMFMPQIDNTSRQNASMASSMSIPMGTSLALNSSPNVNLTTLQPTQTGSMLQPSHTMGQFNHSLNKDLNDLLL